MELTHDLKHAPSPEPVQAPEIETPAPVSPVPLAMGTVMVGHAEDNAEADADARADAALKRLAAKEGGLSAVAGENDAHQHGPGCDHVRRAPAPVPAGAPSVGYEGGALDQDTSAAISGRVGQGRPLEGPVLRRMETAFGTGFGSVRIHDDAAAAKLNHQVSARAFTTGKDIFFGSAQYAPETPDGEQVLAHELAHTLQPPVSVTRMVADGTVQRLASEPAAAGAESAERTQESAAEAETGEPAEVEMEDIPTALREADEATLALVREAKFASEDAWGRRTEEATADLTGEAKQEELDRHEYAWNQALDFKSRLGKAWVALERVEDAESGGAAGAGVPAEGGETVDVAQADPAAREAYDDQLGEVWRLRDELVQLQMATQVDTAAAEAKVVELRAAVVLAGQLAEAVYGEVDEDDGAEGLAAPQAAELQAVFGSRAAGAGGDAKVALREFNQAFGLAMSTDVSEKKDDEDEDEDDDTPPSVGAEWVPEAAGPVIDPGAEAFTMAPHVDAMLDALPDLVVGGGLTLADGKGIAAGSEHRELERLTRDRATAAPGSRSADAENAAATPPPGGPFDDYDADRLADVQDAAVGLWSSVRAVAGQDGAGGPELPDAVGDLTKAAGALSGKPEGKAKKA